MRRPLVAGNWKMYKLVGEAVATIEALKALVAGVDSVDMVVCPPYTALEASGRALAGSPIELGAQDVFTEPSGAFTGAVSVPMVLDAGCAWTIVGHSERRRVFRESDALINQKLIAALNGGLKVMFCIGETLEEREAGSMNDVLHRQVTNGLQGLTMATPENFVIAYEPVWAIGTGVNAEPEQAQEAHAFVRSLLEQHMNGNAASAIRILYGGSVKPSNAGDLMTQADVDGALVGGASLDAKDFADIVEAAA